MQLLKMGVMGITGLKKDNNHQVNDGHQRSRERKGQRVAMALRLASGDAVPSSRTTMIHYTNPIPNTKLGKHRRNAFRFGISCISCRAGSHLSPLWRTGLQKKNRN